MDVDNRFKPIAVLIHKESLVVALKQVADPVSRDGYTGKRGS